jgi:hypothetical protein
MKNTKRVLAILGVILLLGSVLAICALLVGSKNFSDNTVRGLVSCLVALPIVAYGYSILYRYSTRLKKSIQSDINEDTTNDK